MNELIADLKPLSPVLFMFTGAFTALLTGVFLKRENRYVLPYIGLTTTAFAGVALLNYWGRSPTVHFSGAILVDSFGLFVSAIILIACTFTLVSSIGYARRLGFEHGEYVGLILSAGGGMMLLAQSADFVTLFLALEIMSISIYVCAGLARDRFKSNEAAMKYFVLGAFSTGFILFGIAMIYGVTGTTAITALTAVSGMEALAVAGLGLLIIGFGFKVGAAPFHVWVPDAYEGAPASVTGFMAVAVKAAGFAAFLRVILMLFPASAPLGRIAGETVLMPEVWWPVLWAVALLTMFLGNIIAVFQKNVKRMLAYSGIAHTGYILIGFVALGIAYAHEGRIAMAPEQAGAIVGGMLFYLLTYTFMTLGAFAVISVSVRDQEDLESLDDFSGLSRRKPLVALAMTIFLVSMAGVPPLGGFIAKFYVFKGAIDVQNMLLAAGIEQYHALALALLGIGTSAFSVYYYLRVVWFMYFREPGEERATLSPSWGIHFVIFATSVVVVLLGILPSGIFDTARKGAASLLQIG
jgi:NADH-quinone oxidoreductase subunit N